LKDEDENLFIAIVLVPNLYFNIWSNGNMGVCMEMVSFNCISLGVPYYCRISGCMVMDNGNKTWYFLFSSQIENLGLAAKLWPHLTPGNPKPPPEKCPMESITTHILWLVFSFDWFEVIQHDSVELFLFGHILQGYLRYPS